MTLKIHSADKNCFSWKWPSFGHWEFVL